jgi:hypothetical protein
VHITQGLENNGQAVEKTCIAPWPISPRCLWSRRFCGVPKRSTDVKIMEFLNHRGARYSCSR